MRCNEALEIAARRYILHHLAYEGDHGLLVQLLLVLCCEKEGDVVSLNRSSSEQSQCFCSSVIELKLLFPQQAL